MTVSTAPASSATPAASKTQLGHVALRVADLDRAASFYRDLVGLELTAWGPDDGVPLAVFASGGHPLGVTTASMRCRPPSRCGCCSRASWWPRPSRRR